MFNLQCVPWTGVSGACGALTHDGGDELRAPPRQPGRVHGDALVVDGGARQGYLDAHLVAVGGVLGLERGRRRRRPLTRRVPKEAGGPAGVYGLAPRSPTYIPPAFPLRLHVESASRRTRRRDVADDVPAASQRRGRTRDAPAAGVDAHLPPADPTPGARMTTGKGLTSPTCPSTPTTTSAARGRASGSNRKPCTVGGVHIPRV